MFVDGVANFEGEEEEWEGFGVGGDFLGRRGGVENVHLNGFEHEGIGVVDIYEVKARGMGWMLKRFGR